MTASTAARPPAPGGAQAPLLALFRIGVDLERRLEEPGLSSGAPTGIGLTAALTLVLIDTAGPLRPGTIVELTSLTSAGVSQLLERLEASDLVTRSHGAVAGDRRAVVVVVSEAGRRFLATVDEVVAGLSADLVTALEAVRDQLPDGSASSPAGVTTPSATSSSPVLGTLLNVTILIDASIARVVGDSTALVPTDARPHLLLQEVVRRGEVRLGEIPELIGRGRAAAGRLVGRLEAEGVLERVRVVTGGRSLVVVRPTTRGSRLAQAILTRLADDLPDMAPAIDQFIAAVRRGSTARRGSA